MITGLILTGGGARGLCK